MMLLTFADFRPLSVILLRMVRNVQAIQIAMQQPGVSINITDLPTLSIRMATTVLTVGPIIILYPFAQRFFIKGLTVGSIKG
jgi:putative aldouronate transport system permease protein